MNQRNSCDHGEAEELAIACVTDEFSCGGVAGCAPPMSFRAAASSYNPSDEFGGLM